MKYQGTFFDELIIDNFAETKTEPSTYTPTAYSTPSATRFEAVADDGNLPF